MANIWLNIWLIYGQYMANILVIWGFHNILFFWRFWSRQQFHDQFFPDGLFWDQVLGYVNEASGTSDGSVTGRRIHCLALHMKKIAPSDSTKVALPEWFGRLTDLSMEYLEMQQTPEKHTLLNKEILVFPNTLRQDRAYLALLDCWVNVYLSAISCALA